MSFNIVFMGTSDFAREILEYLYLKKSMIIKKLSKQKKAIARIVV